MTKFNVSEIIHKTSRPAVTGGQRTNIGIMQTITIITGIMTRLILEPNTPDAMFVSYVSFDINSPV